MEFVNNHTRIELHFIRWWYNLKERLSSQDHEESPQTNTKQTCFHCRLILFNSESPPWSILQILIIDSYNSWARGVEFEPYMSLLETLGNSSWTIRPLAAFYKHWCIWTTLKDKEDVPLHQAQGSHFG